MKKIATFSFFLLNILMLDAQDNTTDKTGKKNKGQLVLNAGPTYTKMNNDNVTNDPDKIVQNSFGLNLGADYHYYLTSNFGNKTLPASPSPTATYELIELGPQKRH